MNFTYETNGANTYLTYEINASDELDSMSLGMLTNNKIPGFAPALFTQMDATKYIKYNVSAKVSAAQLFSGPVNKKRLLGVFSGIVNAMLSAEDYMLDPQTILLDLDYIFTDVSTCETVLICLPIVREGQRDVELEMFIKNIIFRTQFDQTENCDHVAQIINYLNGNPGLSLHDFKALLERLETTGVPKEQPRQQPVVERQELQQEQSKKEQEIRHRDPEPSQTVVRQAEPDPMQTSHSSQIPIPQPEPDPQPQKEEKPMSFFYLMQHYSKENAAKYKAQQEAKKAKPNKKAAVEKQPVKQQERVNRGFDIPGHETEMPKNDFPIPSQQSRSVQQPVAREPQAQPEQQIQKKSQPEPAPVQSSQHQSAASGNRISFGETTVLGGKIGETTVLGTSAQDASKPNPHLIRLRNNERIPLNKPVFRIGKERSYVDYFIGDNPTVSRSHANIIQREGEFFVVDTNSTNHTYVNGGMIQSNVQTRLTHGTKLRFANEDFEFRMY